MAATKRVLEALPADQLDYTPHEKSRTAMSLATQIALQPIAMLDILKTGAPNFNSHMAESKPLTPAELGANFEKAVTELVSAVKAADDATWGEKALMEGEGMKWETTRRDMIWGFLFDMIHHRGQLSTFIRPMGGKVPAIYGPSGDSVGN